MMKAPPASSKPRRDLFSVKTSLNSSTASGMRSVARRLTGGPATASATRSMERTAVVATSKINQAFRALTIPEPVPLNKRVKLRVCEATEREWNVFVTSENQFIDSKCMVWLYPSERRDLHVASANARKGLILIVEFAGPAHEMVAYALTVRMTRNDAVEAAFAAYGTMNTTTGVQNQPDLSFGPFRQRLEPLGSRLSDPTIPSWNDFTTILVEIGVSQGWGSRLESDQALGEAARCRVRSLHLDRSRRHVHGVQALRLPCAS